MHMYTIIQLNLETLVPIIATLTVRDHPTHQTENEDLTSLALHKTLNGLINYNINKLILCLHDYPSRNLDRVYGLLCHLIFYQN